MKQKQVEKIPCKLMKQLKGHSDFLSIKDAQVCDWGGQISSTITARYWKWVANHHDQMIAEIQYER